MFEDACQECACNIDADLMLCERCSKHLAQCVKCGCVCQSSIDSNLLAAFNSAEAVAVRRELREIAAWRANFLRSLAKCWFDGTERPRHALAAAQDTFETAYYADIAAAESRVNAAQVRYAEIAKERELTAEESADLLAEREAYFAFVKPLRARYSEYFAQALEQFQEETKSARELQECLIQALQQKCDGLVNEFEERLTRILEPVSSTDSSERIENDQE